MKPSLFTLLSPKVLASVEFAETLAGAGSASFASHLTNGPNASDSALPNLVLAET